MVNCDECGRRLSNHSALRRHERTMHSNEKHACAQCHKEFARRDNLQKHQDQGRCHHRPVRVSAQDHISTVSGVDTSLSITVNSPVNQARDFDTATLVQAFEPTSQQTGSQSSFITSEQSVGFPLLHPPMIHHWADIMSPFPNPWQSDMFGRVDCPGVDAHVAEIFTPPFLDQAVRSLRDNFPNAEIQSKMHCCLVHRWTRIPVLRKQQHSIDTSMYKSQHVPAIKCTDCPDGLFCVMPGTGLEPIEDHLHSASHAKRVRLKWIAESETARQALLSVYGAPIILTSLAKLKNEQLSVTGINELYSAKSGQTLLTLAVKNGAIHVLRHLLDEKLNISTKDGSRRSALYWACAFGRLDMAELLLRYGAKLDEPDMYLQTPLDLVMNAKNTGAAVHLIEVEAKIRLEESPQASDTPLALACRYGYISVVETMIRNGANVDEGRFNSPLEVAVRKASCRVVETLLNAGANIHSISTIDRLTLTGKGVYHGVVYPDSEDKISLLKGYGLRL